MKLKPGETGTLKLTPGPRVRRIRFSYKDPMYGHEIEWNVFFDLEPWDLDDTELEEIQEAFRFVFTEEIGDE